jgi:hypothetical protein
VIRGEAQHCTRMHSPSPSRCHSPSHSSGDFHRHSLPSTLSLSCITHTHTHTLTHTRTHANTHTLTHTHTPKSFVRPSPMVSLSSSNRPSFRSGWDRMWLLTTKRANCSSTIGSTVSCRKGGVQYLLFDKNYGTIKIFLV